MSGSRRPEPVDLWNRAVHETEMAKGRAARYLELLREHGYLIPGERQSLPCGWPYRTERRDA